MNTKNISIREKQAIGALCILGFSKNFNIKYEGIDKLVSHLLSLLKADDLSEWNDQGSLLEVVGRGDDLPSELESIVPDNLYEDFYNLIDNAVEIGIIDLFGALTDEPDECLSTCLGILKTHNVNLSVPKVLLDFNYANKSWGEPWDSNKYQELSETVYNN